MGKTIYYGEEKALSSPTSHKAILEPRNKKSKRRKPRLGGKIWLEQDSVH